MNYRFLALVSGLVASAAAAAPPVAGQAGATSTRTNGSPPKAYTAPHTPDGQPDLQGIWTNATYTSLERPKNVTKEFYTREEALELARRAALEENEQTEPGTVADVHYDFTQFGLDRSQGAMALNLRTSLIVDPIDGRLPPAAPYPLLAEKMWSVHNLAYILFCFFITKAIYVPVQPNH